MFDKLDDILIHYEELMRMLGDPDVTQDTKRFTKLMKEQADLAPIVEAYKQYKQAKQDVEDSLAMLEEESDEEMREMAKEELADAKKRIEDLEHELKILLLPKDPNDDKNIILEIRAGAGGDEAALFAAELYRMYTNYADSHRWKVEIISLNENGIGGFQAEIRKRRTPGTACAGDRVRRPYPHLHGYGGGDARGGGSGRSDRHERLPHRRNARLRKRRTVR